MTLIERVQGAYAAELARHGSYDAARMAVMRRYRLSAARLDALLRAAA